MNASCSDKVCEFISLWEKKGYEHGIPDYAPYELEDLNLVPSYRKICKALLKNDLLLLSLGFTKKTTMMYNILKRIELGIKEEARQLELF